MSTRCVCAFVRARACVRVRVWVIECVQVCMCVCMFGCGCGFGFGCGCGCGCGCTMDVCFNELCMCVRESVCERRGADILFPPFLSLPLSVSLWGRVVTVRVFTRVVAG